MPRERRARLDGNWRDEIQIVPALAPYEHAGERRKSGATRNEYRKSKSNRSVPGTPRQNHSDFLYNSHELKCRARERSPTPAPRGRGWKGWF